MEALAIPFLLFVGSLLALQAGANVQLSGAVGSPIGASTLQLAIAAGLLLALTAVLGTLGAFGALTDAEPAHLWGGIGSAVYITAGILLFPRLGALVAVGLFIAGQMGASLLLDGSGWLGIEREPLGPSALAGAFAIVVATWMIVRAQAGGEWLDGALRNRGGWVAAGHAAGAVLPVQGAVNAQLRADVDAPITVGAFSFLVATATMAVMLALLLALRRSPRPAGARLGCVPWWGWLGGACGATYVTSVFVLIPEIGVAPTVALTVAGQQVASVFVDRYGLLRLPRRPISPIRLAGVVLLLAGVALVQLA
jgi:bacterial/archaeal transporter family-2 protein